MQADGDKEVCQAAQRCPRYQRRVNYRCCSLEQDVCYGTRLLEESCVLTPGVRTRAWEKITLKVHKKGATSTVIMRKYNKKYIYSKLELP